MNDFLKVYTPILTAILLFSGFWYVKAYFGYFGMREVPPELSIEYLLQMSSVVIFALFAFTVPVYSFIIFIFVGVPFLLHLMFPEKRIINHADQQINPLLRIVEKGVNKARGVSILIKALLVFVVSGYAILNISQTVGTIQACEVIEGRTNAITRFYNFSVPSDLDEEPWNQLMKNLDDFAQVQQPDTDKSPEENFLVEIWRNSDWIYLSYGTPKCAENHFTVKLATKAVPLSVIQVGHRPENDSSSESHSDGETDQGDQQ